MDSNDTATIVVRPACMDDKSFILSTWLKGNYYGNDYFKQIPAYLYYEDYAHYIENILSTPGVFIDIACDNSNPHWIVGFLVYQGNTIHWAYTKRDYREKGILKLLAKAKCFIATTATTKIGQAIAKDKGLIFNPLKEETNV